MANALQGKLLYLKIDGKELECQTDLTLNMTTNTADEEACKPLSTETNNAALWVKRSVSSKEWDASVSAKTFIADVTANNTNASELLGLFITGDNMVEVTIQTNEGNDEYGQPKSGVFTGSAIMNGLTLNGPSEGDSTVDITFISNGEPTWVTATIVPAP